MKIPIDIDTYKANFLGGNARQYLFWVQINFPGWGNAAKAGLQGVFANGIPSFVSLGTSLMSGAIAGASAGLDIMGLNNGTNKFGYQVKSTNLPSSSFESTSTYFAGQEYKTSGMQKFEDWTVTFNIDNEGVILRKFYDWHNVMRNTRTNEYGNPIVYMSDQEVHLLGMETGETICVYKLFGAWPSQIGQVTLDYNGNDFATVDITFTYQYHTVEEKEQGAVTQIMKQYLANINLFK
jgi:hypothetical protein